MPRPRALDVLAVYHEVGSARKPSAQRAGAGFVGFSEWRLASLQEWHEKLEVHLLQNRDLRTGDHAPESGGIVLREAVLLE